MHCILFHFNFNLSKDDIYLIPQVTNRTHGIFIGELTSDTQRENLWTWVLSFYCLYNQFLCCLCICKLQVVVSTVKTINTSSLKTTVRQFPQPSVTYFVCFMVPLLPIATITLRLSGTFRVCRHLLNRLQKEEVLHQLRFDCRGDGLYIFYVASVHRFLCQFVNYCEKRFIYQLYLRTFTSVYSYTKNLKIANTV